MKRATQITFIDHDNIKRNGIMLPDGEIICGCCGEIYEIEDIGALEEGHLIEVTEVSKEWEDIS